VQNTDIRRQRILQQSSRKTASRPSTAISFFDQVQSTSKRAKSSDPEIFTTFSKYVGKERKEKETKSHRDREKHRDKSIQKERRKVPCAIVDDHSRAASGIHGNNNNNNSNNTTPAAAIQDSERNPTLATPRFSFAFDVASLGASQQASEQQTAVVQALEAAAPERLLRRTLIAKKGNYKL